MSDHDLSGDWVRVGEPDCHGTIPLEYLPLDQEIIRAEWIRIEQRDDNTLTFHIDGISLLGNGEGVLQDDGVIRFEYDYGIVVDYIPELTPPEALYYDEVYVNREAYLDDAMQVVFEDTYSSRDRDLFCTHVFEGGQHAT
ncbi:MAG: hypothetical protein OXC69_08650 [Candidatus Tectomicrobia bacterium]|nr:hypothetical protein [Candidatus Tectomicrobia bacterium]